MPYVAVNGISGPSSSGTITALTVPPGLGSRFTRDAGVVKPSTRPGFLRRARRSVMPASRGSGGPWLGRGAGTAVWAPGDTAPTCPTLSPGRAGTATARSLQPALLAWHLDRLGGD